VIRSRVVLLSVAVISYGLSVGTGDSRACDGPADVRTATSASIREFVEGKGRKVLTFAGYSGAGYEDPKRMLDEAARILDGEDPAKTLVNIGATKVGIGAVYELAKAKGFTTMGIASTLARDENVELSPCVDHVFFVEDTQWGGKLEGTEDLSPTSRAMVESSTIFVAIGGGDTARDELLAARAAGKETKFIPADMSHAIAREKAGKQGSPEPTDFRGAAHAAVGESR
jgi:hypothetical protein